MRDFEDYCWRDVVTEAELHIYSAYVRERGVGKHPALLVVHPGAGLEIPAAWTGPAAQLLSEARRRGLLVRLDPRELVRVLGAVPVDAAQ